jgi:hypothetical protein
MLRRAVRASLGSYSWLLVFLNAVEPQPLRFEKKLEVSPLKWREMTNR